MTVATSITSPASRTQGKKVYFQPLHLDELSGAMDKMGWTVGPRMMRRWFSTQPAWIMPLAVRNDKVDPMTLLPSQYDDQILKLKWVLSFPRVIPAFNDLVKNWASPAGIKQLDARLRKAGWTPGKSITLGSPTMGARTLDSTCQVNFRAIGTKTDTIDDLYAAIGIGELRLAVIGRTAVQQNKDVFLVDRMGVYVRDSFDFHDDPNAFVSEPLGVWSRDRCLTKLEAINFATNPVYYGIYKAQGFVAVFNDDYRRWQKANNSGGDFIAYSDVQWYLPFPHQRVIPL